MGKKRTQRRAPDSTPRVRFVEGSSALRKSHDFRYVPVCSSSCSEGRETFVLRKSHDFRYVPVCSSSRSEGRETFGRWHRSPKVSRLSLHFRFARLSCSEGRETFGQWQRPPKVSRLSLRFRSRVSPVAKVMRPSEDESLTTFATLPFARLSCSEGRETFGRWHRSPKVSRLSLHFRFARLSCSEGRETFGQWQRPPKVSRLSLRFGSRLSPVAKVVRPSGDSINPAQN